MLNQCTCFHSYRPQAVIKVTGEDAGSFLQGQFTNDLQQRQANAAYGLWLNQKGRVVGDSWILRLGENEFHLVSITSDVAVITRRLEDYIIADDVSLADETAKFSGLGLWGPGCRECVQNLFGAVPKCGEFIRAEDCLLFGGRRIDKESYEIVGPDDKVAVLCTRLRGANYSEVNVVEAEWARISSGIPSIPHDIGPGDLPNEGGLEQTAISYTKGCYLGQEVMARLKNMGQVRRKLHVVRGDGAPPKPRDALYQNGKKVGELRSVVGRGNEFVALAMLALLNLNLGVGLSHEADGAATVRVMSHE